MVDIKRPVLVCGENPIMTLFAEGSDRPALVASFWHVTYSRFGTGNLLVLWSDPGVGAPPGGLYTDAPDLIPLLVEALTQHFPEFEGLSVADLPLRPASCHRSWDGHRYLVDVVAEADAFTLEWSGPLDQKLVVRPGFPAGERTFDLTTVICPCRDARVGGKEPLAARPQGGPGPDGIPSSSAFIALAESWVGPLS